MENSNKPKLNIHFIDGPFVEIMGKSDCDNLVEFIDVDTREVVHSGIIKPNCWIRPSRKWFTNWKIRIAAATNISDQGGTVNHTHDLDLSVVDSNDNFIEDALVVIEQSEGKETFAYVSHDGSASVNGSGNVTDGYGYKALATEMEEGGNEAFTTWSGSVAGGTYHKITVSKEGYKPWVRKVAFDRDWVMTAKLQPVGSTRLISQE